MTMNNSKIYRQADSRWGKLPYPTKKYTFAHNGCGCCAVTHNAIEVPKYRNYTPADVRKYMVQFATKGHGTTWNGITKGLQHYGYTVKMTDSMTTVFNAVKKTGAPKQGVFLFTSKLGGSAKVRWTGGGHYVAFLDAKYEDGDYWFYTKDSGGRHRDGWHSYKRHMKGAIRKVWVCTKAPFSPVPKPTGKYACVIPSPTLKKNSKGNAVKSLQKFLNWYGKYNLELDGKFGNKTDEAVRSFQASESLFIDGVFGPKSYAVAKKYVK